MNAMYGSRATRLLLKRARLLKSRRKQNAIPKPAKLQNLGSASLRTMKSGFMLGMLLSMPLLLEFTFADGSRDTTSVPGRLRTIEKTYSHAAPPKGAALNPKNEILDINLSDNVLPRRRTLQIDWPKNDYYREDAYTIRHRPFAWYNDVDGARLATISPGATKAGAAARLSACTTERRANGSISPPRTSVPRPSLANG